MQQNQTAAGLAPIELVDSTSGRLVRLGDLWSDRTALLIFLRHFG